MNFHIKKSRAPKLLVLITVSIVLISITIKAQAQEKGTTGQKMLENAIYYDKNTGLEWLAGPDKATNWNDAVKWVGNLTGIAGGGWRMPTLKELETLYQKGKKCNLKPFLKTTGCWVWSGETKGSSLAWGYDYFYEPGGSILSGGSVSGSGPVTLNRDDSTSSSRGFAVRSRK